MIALNAESTQKTEIIVIHADHLGWTKKECGMKSSSQERKNNRKTVKNFPTSENEFNLMRKLLTYFQMIINFPASGEILDQTEKRSRISQTTKIEISWCDNC